MTSLFNYYVLLFSVHMRDNYIPIKDFAWVNLHRMQFCYTFCSFCFENIQGSFLSVKMHQSSLQRPPSCPLNLVIILLNILGIPTRSKWVGTSHILLPGAELRVWGFFPACPWWEAGKSFMSWNSMSGLEMCLWTGKTKQPMACVSLGPHTHTKMLAS